MSAANKSMSVLREVSISEGENRGVKMTIESRIVFDLTEIKSVIFECTTCGARTSLPLGKVDYPPQHCPAGHSWNWNVRTGYQSTESPFRALLSALAKLRDPLLGQMGFNLFLEIDGASGRVSSDKG